MRQRLRSPVVLSGIQVTSTLHSVPVLGNSNSLPHSQHLHVFGPYHSLTKSPSLPVGLIAPVAPKLIVCLSLYSVPLCIHPHRSCLSPPPSLCLFSTADTSPLSPSRETDSSQFPQLLINSLPPRIPAFHEGHRHLYMHTSFHVITSVSCMYVLFFPETVNSLRQGQVPFCSSWPRGM